MVLGCAVTARRGVRRIHGSPGDVIGDYSFAQPLQIGQRLVFMDMSHYTFVKNTTFNGVPLPAIATFDPASGQTQVIRRFGYADYKNRLS